MDVSILAYYKDKGNKNNTTSCRHRLIALWRLVAAIFITMTYPLPSNAQKDTSDTTYHSLNTHAYHVDFKVNLTDIDISYHDNGPALEKALAGIDSIVLDPNNKVERITIVGTASPEGPYHNNVRLSKERARVLTSIIKTRYSFPDSIYTISTIPEDWSGMRLMLTDNNSIPYAEVVLKFLDGSESDNPDIRESHLKCLDNGRPYSSMRDNVLPYLRRASAVVVYGNVRQSIPQLPLALRPEQLTSNLATPASGTQPVATTMTAPIAGHRRFLSVKTNLLWDAALCANLGFEIELWPHWSLDVPVWYSPYDITDRWRIRLLATQPEVRYWPKDAGAGHYFGIHASLIGFNVSTNGDFRYQDPNHAASGLGIGYGYAFHLDKAHRWSLEAQIGAGYINYKWIKYHNTGRNGAEVSHGGGTYWGLTRAGITISYKFYRDRKGRRWMKW